MSPRCAGALARPGAPRVSPARACAFTVLRRVFEHGAYADRALRSEAEMLAPRDRALATVLVFGTVQRRATLDHVLQRLSSRLLDKLDPPVLAALRLGTFQLLLLDGVADHAAVSESVELVKAGGRGGATLVNAVLRRAIREGPAILDELDDSSPETAAVLHSVPRWLAVKWWTELGSGEARDLLRTLNQPAEAAIRVNELVSSPAALAPELPVATDPAPGLPEGLVLREPFDVHGSRLFAAGALMPQSRGSMLVARVLAPEPGERVLDLCAAPGGKTTQMAALMGDEGEIVAVERHPGRARALERTCRRMRATAVRVEIGDATEPRTERPYERVLVDPPCSGLGTLQSRPDLRWRVRPENVGELADIQARILASGAEATAAGGVLVYSVCTISREEGAAVVEAFLSSHVSFCIEDLSQSFPQWADPVCRGALQLLPHRDGTDGFFIARLRHRDDRPAR